MVGAAVTAGAAVVVGAAVIAGAAVVVGAVVVGAVVAAGVMVFVFGSNGRLMLLGVCGLPGITSSKSKCELCATPLGLNRSPAASAGVRLSPTLTGVLPSESTTVPFDGSPVTSMLSEEEISLGTAMFSALPKSEL